MRHPKKALRYGRGERVQGQKLSSRITTRKVLQYRYNRSMTTTLLSSLFLHGSDAAGHELHFKDIRPQKDDTCPLHVVLCKQTRQLSKLLCAVHVYVPRSMLSSGSQRRRNAVHWREMAESPHTAHCIARGKRIAA
jgi:hypothetical protein